MSLKYKLYGTPISPFTYLIYATLVYKNIDFDFEIVDLGVGKHKTSEYLELQPFGQVPVLQTDKEQIIYESWSILEFLEETFPHSPILPQKQPVRANVRTLCLVVAGSIIPLARELLMDTLGRLPLSNEARKLKEDDLVMKLQAFSLELEKVLPGIKDFTPLEPLFYQTWLNLNIAAPRIAESFPFLQDFVTQISENPIIISVESSSLVKAVRCAFSQR